MIAPPLYVLRHGQTEWNAAGRLQGRFDSPLTETGRAQAAMQHSILKSLDLTGFSAFSSPQGRAFQTAAIALQGLVQHIHTDERLSEIGLGEWAGQDRAVLLEQEGLIDGFDLYERAPGGEGFAQLHARCLAFLKTLEQPAILVTHGITSRLVRLILTGREIADLREIEGGQGVVFEVRDGIQTRLCKKA